MRSPRRHTGLLWTTPRKYVSLNLVSVSTSTHLNRLRSRIRTQIQPLEWVVRSTPLAQGHRMIKRGLPAGEARSRLLHVCDYLYFFTTGKELSNGIHE